MTKHDYDLEDYLDDLVDRINELTRYIRKPGKSTFPVGMYSDGKHQERMKRRLERRHDFRNITIDKFEKE